MREQLRCALQLHRLCLLHNAAFEGSTPKWVFVYIEYETVFFHRSEGDKNNACALSCPYVAARIHRAHFVAAASRLAACHDGTGFLALRLRLVSKIDTVRLLSFLDVHSERHCPLAWRNII
jgi:hypothetical protein